jgi:hypothetical protein
VQAPHLPEGGGGQCPRRHRPRADRNPDRTGEPVGGIMTITIGRAPCTATRTGRLTWLCEVCGQLIKADTGHLTVDHGQAIQRRMEAREREDQRMACSGLHLHHHDGCPVSRWALSRPGTRRLRRWRCPRSRWIGLRSPSYRVPPTLSPRFADVDGGLSLVGRWLIRFWLRITVRPCRRPVRSFGRQAGR